MNNDNDNDNNKNVNCYVPLFLPLFVLVAQCLAAEAHYSAKVNPSMSLP